MSIEMSTASRVSTVRPVRSGESFLRLVLRADAAVTAANGIAYLWLADVVDGLLGVSAPMQRGIGAFLVAFAALVAVVATRTPIARGGVALIVAANAAWAIGSVAAAVAGAGTPTTAGTVWIVLQAAVVAAFAELELMGLKRARGGRT